jgi:hypothetical protein
VSEAVRLCPYCGGRIGYNRLVCNAHSDLPNLDPQLTRPKIQAQPIGVKPFEKGL